MTDMANLAPTSVAFVILQILKEKPLHIFTRDNLLALTDRSEDVFDRAIDAHIKKIRSTKHGIHIKQVYCEGYFYEPYPDNYLFISSLAPRANYLLWEVIDPERRYKSDTLVSLGSFELDIGCNRLFFGKRFFQVPHSEMLILKLFFTSKISNRPYSSEEIQHYLSENGGGKKSISLFFKNIRLMFEALAESKARKIIRSVYSIGYQLDADLACRFKPNAFKASSNEVGKRKPDSVLAPNCSRPENTAALKSKNPENSNT